MRIKQTTMNKALMAFKVLLVVMPFILLMMMNQAATIEGQALAELLKTNGAANVQLLSAFVLPFMALMIHQQRFEFNNFYDQVKVITNLFLVGLAIMFVGYVSLGGVLMIMTVLITNINDISYAAMFRYIKQGKLPLKDVGGSLALIIIGLFVGLLLMRVS